MDNVNEFSDEATVEYDADVSETETWGENEGESLVTLEDESAVGVDLEQFAPATAVDLDTAVPLTYEEAVVLTEHIRATADVLYVLVQRAHAGKAWEPLGYSSFGEYVKAEFNISRSRAYQLLNQASIIEQIEAAAPEGTQISINEATARDLKSMVDELVPEIELATADLDSAAAQVVIDDMIAKFREESRAKESENDTEGDDLFPSFGEGDEAESDSFGGGGEYPGGSGFGGGEYQGGSGHGSGDGPVQNEDFDPDFDAFDELFSGDDDPRETRKRLEDVYNLYNALSALKNMRNFEEMVDLIPQERRIQITASLPVATEWLNNFNEHWHRQPWVNEDAPEVEEGSDDLEDGDIFGDL